MEEVRAGSSAEGDDDEKTPLLRVVTTRSTHTIRTIPSGPTLPLIPLHRDHPPTPSQSPKARRRRRILAVLFLITLAYALLRRIIPFTSSWVCLSASRFFLISTTKCQLPDWYDVGPPPKSGDLKINATHVPDYVYEYAPLVRLFSDEKYWPCDMGEHLHHVTPEIDYTPIDLDQSAANISLSTLGDLNAYTNGHHLYLTSNDDVSTYPSWLIGAKNKPSPFTATTRTVPSSATPTSTHPHIRPPSSSPSTVTTTSGGRSQAPAVLVTVQKTPEILDAFFFFFYSYNHGNEVLRLRFGNHVGDWEHTMIRFVNSTPKAVFFSEHDFGAAYAYSAVEKVGKRPVLYSATGTHAMYATPGTQSYILPWGLLHDRTDRGPMWDVRENLISYTYQVQKDVLTPAEGSEDAPTSWFFYKGRWGDKRYPLADPRQYSFLGERHYVSGPLGPRFKHLGRRKVCQGPFSERCELKHWLGGGVAVGSKAVESAAHAGDGLENGVDEKEGD